MINLDRNRTPEERLMLAVLLSLMCDAIAHYQGKKPPEYQPHNIYQLAYDDIISGGEMVEHCCTQAGFNVDYVIDTFHRVKEIPVSSLRTRFRL